jgi:hypothetical protein
MRLRFFRCAALTLVAAALNGCVGSIGSGEDEGGPGGDDDDGVVSRTSQFECNPDLIAPELPLRRLSRVQYKNSVQDLIARFTGNDTASVLAEVDAAIETMPDDLKKGTDVHYALLHRLDQSVYQETIDSAYAVGEAVGRALTSSSARLENLAGACATDADTANDVACAEDFVRSFGERALRRPLNDEDVAFYTAVIDGPVETPDYVDMVTMLLSAPQFLYLVEHGADDAAAGKPAALTGLEMASRLSYHFWQTAPDDELLGAAKDGSLLTDAGFDRQVDRLFKDARTVEALDEFFADWLNPHHLGELDANLGTAAFDAFRGDFTPSPELRDNMMAELVGMTAYFSHGSEGTFEEMFTSNSSFARTPDVAELYGVPVWTDGAPPAFPQSERTGLISRAALTATGGSATRPVMKGVFVRKAMLCEVIKPPPADSMTVANTLEGQVFSSREKAQAITELRDDCAGCHATVINPLGFITENYDGLGRFRTEEPIFDPFSGELLATKPVDAVAVPQVLPTDERTANSPADLNQFLLESEKPQACFARQYFRFTFGRTEADEEDGCTLAAMHEALLEGDSLGSVLKTIARRPEFRRRSFDQ